MPREMSGHLVIDDSSQGPVATLKPEKEEDGIQEKEELELDEQGAGEGRDRLLRLKGREATAEYSFREQKRQPKGGPNGDEQGS